MSSGQGRRPGGGASATARRSNKEFLDLIETHATELQGKRKVRKEQSAEEVQKYIEIRRQKKLLKQQAKMEREEKEMDREEGRAALRQQTAAAAAKKDAQQKGSGVIPGESRWGVDRASLRRTQADDEVARMQLEFEKTRNVSIEESKHLGGQENTTFLVKGLDEALLRKRRQEIAETEARFAPLPAASAPPVGSKTADASGLRPFPSTLRSYTKSREAREFEKLVFADLNPHTIDFGSKLARIHAEIHTLPIGVALGGSSRKFLPGLTSLSIDVAEDSFEVPREITKASDDASELIAKSRALVTARIAAPIIAEIDKAEKNAREYRKNKRDQKRMGPSAQPVLPPQKGGIDAAAAGGLAGKLVGVGQFVTATDADLDMFGDAGTLDFAQINQEGGQLSAFQSSAQAAADSARGKNDDGDAEAFGAFGEAVSGENGAAVADSSEEEDANLSGAMGVVGSGSSADYFANLGVSKGAPPRKEGVRRGGEAGESDALLAKIRDRTEAAQRQRKLPTTDYAYDDCYAGEGISGDFGKGLGFDLNEEEAGGASRGGSRGGLPKGAKRKKGDNAEDAKKKKKSKAGEDYAAVAAVMEKRFRD